MYTGKATLVAKTIDILSSRAGKKALVKF